MENNEPKPETGSLADATAMLLGEPKTEENQVAEEVVEATDETADVAVEENVTEEDTTNTQRKSKYSKTFQIHTLLKLMV